MWWHYFSVLLPAGILAGISSSVAGLASLISYPALLAVGIPAVFANVTNTTALVFTGIGSGVASRRELRGHGSDLLKLLPLTVGGSISGGLLLLAAPASSFEHIVPFFIFSAALLILRPELLRITARGRQEVCRDASAASAFRMRASKIAFGVAVFLVGVYTGYFGAAGGVIMLALLAATSRSEFAEYNAMKNVSLGAANLFATLLFIFRAHIYWLAAAPLAVGFFFGGFIGPHIVRHVHARLLRILISVGAVGLAVYLFTKTYLG